MQCFVPFVYPRENRNLVAGSFSIRTVGCSSVPTDRRSFRTGPKKILDDRSVQDLKIAKRTSRDLLFDLGTIIRFFKKDSL